MDCPRCAKPMKLLRENYEQEHEDESCPHLPHDGEDPHSDCLRLFDEYNCEPCQVGIHPDKGPKK